MRRVSPLDVVVEALDYDIIIIEFELQSLYYVQFRSKIFGESMKLLVTQLWVEY